DGGNTLGCATITCDGLEPEASVPIHFDDSTLPPALRIIGCMRWMKAPSETRTPSPKAGASFGGARQIKPTRRATRENMMRTTFSAMLSFTYMSTPQQRTMSYVWLPMMCSASAISASNNFTLDPTELRWADPVCIA